MFRRIYYKFPIFTWLILHILLFLVECAVREISGIISFISFIIAVEAIITLCISCVVSLKRTELWIYKIARIICVLPIIVITCMLSGETIMDRIDGKNLYVEVEVMYNYLKEYEFNKMEIDTDDNAVILYPDYQAEKTDEGIVIDIDNQGHDSLKYLDRKIKNARSLKKGILFAYDYTWDGDWYALYVSKSPDIQWLNDLNAEQITPRIYDVLVPWNDLFQS